MRLGIYSCSTTFLAVISCTSHSAIAQGLTPFRYEAQAQRYCPEDTIVWLDFKKGALLPEKPEALRIGIYRQLRMPE